MNLPFDRTRGTKWSQFMYKIKRFSLFNFNKIKFIEDTSDLDDLDEDRFLDEMVKRYPDLKFMKSVFKIQDKISSLNMELDDYSLWKDCELFTIPGVYDYPFIDKYEFINTTKETRKNTKYNSYISLIYDGYSFLNYDIEGKRYVLMSPWDSYKISKIFSNISQFTKYCIGMLESIFNDPLIKEDLSESELKKAYSILSRYKSLLNSIR